MNGLHKCLRLHNTLKVITRRCADCCVEPDFATLEIKIEIALYYERDTRHQMDTWSQKDNMCAKRIASKCPIEELLVLIGGRWKPVILWWLIDSEQPLRFKVLRQSIPRISQKILTQQLRELERDGLVKREMFAEMPVRVEYSPTSFGSKLWPVLQELDAWARRYLL